MIIGRVAQTTTVAVVAAGLLCGCGSKHAATPAASSDCLGAVEARASVAVVRTLYREGKLGSAAAVERQVRRLRGLKLPFPVTSFLGAKGELLPWSRMNWKQRLTFDQWLALPRVTDVASRPILEASMRATDRARTTTCASG